MGSAAKNIRDKHVAALLHNVLVNSGNSNGGMSVKEEARMSLHSDPPILVFWLERQTMNYDQEKVTVQIC